jgi:hypothetical protein
MEERSSEAKVEFWNGLGAYLEFEKCWGFIWKVAGALVNMDL